MTDGTRKTGFVSGGPPTKRPNLQQSHFAVAARKLKGDLRFDDRIRHTSVLFDMSLTMPFAKGQPASLRSAKFATQKTETDKFRHYSAFISTFTAYFRPLVYDYNGGNGKEVDKAIRYFSELAYPGQLRPDGTMSDTDGLRSLFVRDMRERTSIALQYGRFYFFTGVL